MRRREFIALVGGAAFGWPRYARSQAATPLIGYLSSKGETVEAGIVAALRKGLAQRGYVDGQNVAMIYRWSEGDYSLLPQFAAELVEKRVSAIVASGLPAALAAKAATATIPIVIRLAVDPVAFGLAQSLNRPGGNVTGVTMLFDLLTPKKFQLLHELVPAAATMGLLVNPHNQNAASHQDNAEKAAQALGLNLVVMPVGNGDELERAFAAGRKSGIGALVVGDDPLFDVVSGQLIDVAAHYQLPTMYYVRDFVVPGGLVSYGPSFDEMSEQVGIDLGRILEGQAAADLPIQQPTKIELVVNLKTAKVLGLTIPEAFLLRADEVIE
jgi:putative ABC transport system substrate-binding protein